MNIIKLDATASTNTYLKELISSCELENFTSVVAEHQFAGRGQRGAEWVVESGSNLTFSVLVNNLSSSLNGVFNLNVMVACSVSNALKKNCNLPIEVKWPNDILSYNKKVGGILIENILRADGSLISIIGIGINVNQTNFDHLSQASSLCLLSNQILDKDSLMMAILKEIEHGVMTLCEGKSEVIWKEYKQLLFRKDKVSTFELPDGKRFVGIIRDVTNFGKLVVEGEDEKKMEFALKEIKLLY